MRIKHFLSSFFCLFLIFSIISCEGIIGESDSQSFQLVSFFDLRDRETFIQLTNVESSGVNVHVQIFDVANNCNENDFFDGYTGNDTHVYNLRNIETNDENPSGVVLPQNSYGFVVITLTQGLQEEFFQALIGNFRVIDNNGYEYRTNMLARTGYTSLFEEINPDFTFNYNVQGEVSLSDIVGFTATGSFFENGTFEARAADLTEAWALVDIDILDLNENVFSCRNVIFACTDQDNPLLEELLEYVSNTSKGSSANVASFEYGINDAVPHSKGGELLCPGNNIEEGFVSINVLNWAGTGGMYIGLNNGNGRGSMDSFWVFNRCLVPGSCEENGMMM